MFVSYYSTRGFEIYLFTRLYLVVAFASTTTDELCELFINKQSYLALLLFFVPHHELSTSVVLTCISKLIMPSLT